MKQLGHSAKISMRSLVVALLLCALSSHAHADWLVTTDGRTIETRGAWTVAGKLVQFNTAAGTLSSLRVAEVDLEASRAETARRNAPPAPAPVPGPAAAKKPLLVLTDADVKHADPTTAAAAEADSRGPVVLYTTAWCGYCRKTRTLLTSLGQEFEDKDIEKSAAARREYEAKGNGYTGIPLIDFDGTIIRGYNESKLRRLVAERQKPAAEADAQAD